MRTTAIGIQDFETIQTRNYFYVDKTDFIRQWWEAGDAVTLLTRPRRFGKTLTMDMLDKFFSVKYSGRADLFEKLDIWKREEYRAIQGTYPVIFLSFANVKETTFESTRKKINQILQDCYQNYKFLLNGGTLHTELDEQIVYNQLYAVWNLLLACGYLKADGREFIERSGKTWYDLKLTNKEVLLMFDQMIHGWFSGYTSNYNSFIKALFRNDVKEMNAYMNRVSQETFSFFDSGNRPSQGTQPERFYHGFVLGLLVELRGRYLLTSNRESGFGRYDVMLEPLEKKDDAYILEFKVLDPLLWICLSGENRADWIILP